MAKKSIALLDLAKIIEKQDTANIDRWHAIRDLTTALDEKFFKSSRIEKRGDFLEMCGMEK
jgi:hypothetical protein